MWLRRRRLAAELAADCEAFLLGRYVERLEQQKREIPVWAWTNLLAHASESELRDEAELATVGGAPGGWRSARACLASELLQATKAECGLVTLQSCVLAPLEHDLSVRPDTSRWGPRRWMDVVRDALRSHRPSHQA